MDFGAFVEQLPGSSRVSFARLLESRERPVETLRVEIKHYAKAIETAGQSSEVVDTKLGLATADACNRLLDAYTQATAEHRRLVNAAVEYFLLTRDGDDDLASPDGFVDDAAVVEATLRELGVR